MGWRERDWAKFTDDECRALFGGGASPGRRWGGTVGGVPPPPGQPPARVVSTGGRPARRGKSLSTIESVALLVGGVALWLLLNYVNVVGGPLDDLGLTRAQRHPQMPRVIYTSRSAPRPPAEQGHVIVKGATVGGIPFTVDTSSFPEPPHGCAWLILSKQDVRVTCGRF
jgi:hypothetical protein